LPSPRTPRTTRSSVTSPDEISLSPGDLDTSLCDICMCSISVFEDPVDMPCGHDFCRGCWESIVISRESLPMISSVNFTCKIKI
ncbi:ANKIB1 isoform 5, partial [Pan troglodytes]